MLVLGADWEMEKRKPKSSLIAASRVFNPPGSNGFFFFLSFSSSSLNWTEYMKVIESNALGSLFNESTGDR